MFVLVDTLLYVKVMFVVISVMVVCTKNLCAVSWCVCCVFVSVRLLLLFKKTRCCAFVVIFPIFFVSLNASW